MKKILFVFLILFLSPAFADDDLTETVTTGRGRTHEQAMQNAIEEALRSNGALVMARDELSNDVFARKIIQVSRGSVRDARILSKEEHAG